MDPLGDYGDESDGGEVVLGVPVISGCDTSPVFEPAEKALDDISSTICTPVERIWCATRGGRRDDGFNLSCREPFAQAVGVISLIGEQAPWWRHRTEQRDGDADDGDVARRQGDGDRSAAIVGQAMDFARPPAARAPDRFFKLPLFEPAAERCALTWLLSIDNSFGTGPDAAIFSNSRCQIRRCDQRL